MYYPKQLCCSEATIRKEFINPDGECYQLKGLVGQPRARGYCHDLIYSVMRAPDYLVPTRALFVGPPSCGKTWLARRLNRAMHLVQVLTSFDQINSPDDLAAMILASWWEFWCHPWDADNRTAPIRVNNHDYYDFSKAPMYIFIDEIHRLSPTVQDSLLKATEANDGTLIGKKYALNVKGFIWVGATTDFYALRPAFQSRWDRVDFDPPTYEEVIQIVQNNNPTWDWDFCTQIVKYGGMVPRQAMSFAKQVARNAESSGYSVVEALEAVRVRERIDEHGMRQESIKVLQVLQECENGALLRHLADELGCPAGDVTRIWLPPLLRSRLVEYNSRYYITDKGKEELRKRAS